MNIEKLPFDNASVDLVTANLVLPWHENLMAALREWRRVLRPHGLLILTHFGPDTLREFTDFPLHLPYVIDMHDMGDVLIKAGFSDPVLDVDYTTLTYRDHAKMLHELQVTGMIEGEINTIQITPNTNGIFSNTYEIVHGHAWVPEILAQAPNERGEVHIPVSRITRKL